MIGWIAAGKAIYGTVSGLTVVTTAIEDRFYPNEAPAGTKGPYGRYYQTGGVVSGRPIGAGVNAETLTFTIELLDIGSSIGSIDDAAVAIQEAIHAMRYVTDDGYSVTGTYLRPTSFPLPSVMGQAYVRLAGDFEAFVSYP